MLYKLYNYITYLMRLLKSENALNGGGITKFSLKCDENRDDWLNLLDILYQNDNETAIILKGIYENKKDIVLKIGIKIYIDKEFEIAEKLKELPNFMRYYCKFICFDNIHEIIKNKNMISTYNLCINGKDEIGILTMNYYKLGSIGNFNWKIEDLDILKNILKQTIYCLLMAYINIGFIHGDLHCDNILLKNKRVEYIDYTFTNLKIDTYEVRIMDFEKSRIDKKLEFKIFLDNIQKLFDSIRNNDRYKIKFNYKSEILRKMRNRVINDNITTDNVNKSHYKMLNSIINSFLCEL
jgi:hypothetical protein